jgi:hypothetical protein
VGQTGSRVTATIDLPHRLPWASQGMQLSWDSQGTHILCPSEAFTPAPCLRPRRPSSRGMAPLINVTSTLAVHLLLLSGTLSGASIDTVVFSTVFVLVAMAIEQLQNPLEEMPSLDRVHLKNAFRGHKRKLLLSLHLCRCLCYHPLFYLQPLRTLRSPTPLRHLQTFKEV